MLAIITNIVLFSLLLLSHLCKRNKTLAPSVLIALYTFVAIGGLNYSENRLVLSNISVFYSLYFFVVVYIFLIPLLKTDISINKIRIRENSLIKFILYAYVLFALIATKGYLGYIMESLANGDWMKLKTNAYNGDMNLPNDFINVISRIVVNVLKYAVLIYGFWLLTNPNKSFKVALFWIIVSVLPSLSADLASAYRGGLFISIVMLIYLYFLFKDQIIQRNKRLIKYFFLVVFTFFAILLLAITLSRFEENSFNSILSYFGQSFVNYNYGIASRIQDYSGGKFFLGNLIGLDMDQIMIDNRYGILTNNGEDLDTFVGIMIFDFGFILTIIIALFISNILCLMFKKHKYDLADLFIYVFYLHFLLNGVFHFPWNYAQTCIYTIIAYVIMKLSNKISFNNT